MILLAKYHVKAFTITGCWEGIVTTLDDLFTVREQEVYKNLPYPSAFIGQKQPRFPLAVSRFRNLKDILSLGSQNDLLSLYPSRQAG